MQKHIDSIKELYKVWSGEEVNSIDVLPQSGSERRYFRLYGARSESVKLCPISASTGQMAGLIGLGTPLTHRRQVLCIWLAKNFMR